MLIPGHGLQVPHSVHRILSACGIKDASADINGSTHVVNVMKAVIQLLHGGVSLSQTFAVYKLTIRRIHLDLVMEWEDRLSEKTRATECEARRRLRRREGGTVWMLV
jgi:hypothetical protein